LAESLTGINPLVLKWAREQMGLSPEDVAVRLKKDAEKIIEWEKGASAPTYCQLESLAYTIYKRPIAVFFFPEPPEEPDPKDSFRTLPDFEMNQLQPKTFFAIRKAMARQLAIGELTNGTNPSKNQIFKDIRINARGSIAKYAESIRAYLGIDMTMQKAWKTTEDALKKWRNAIEDKGIFVFKESKRVIQEDISGFCLHDDEFPVIYVNNSNAKSRQIFSIFHELSHLLMGINGISKVDFRSVDYLDPQNREMEVFCNRLSAEILLPEVEFLKLPVLRNHNQEMVRKTANRYKVSREFILRRLLDKGIISQEEYQDKHEREV
jgi:Zn-dependent peptidase ImmA (M78 family)